MKIVVVGAGVVGVTTTYLLARNGHSVTVIDKNSSIAAGASHANGGQLSYDFASPMATPALLKKLPTILRGRDLAFRLKPQIDLGFLGWSVRFLNNCLPAKARKNEQELARQSRESGDVFNQILQHVDIDFAHRRAGKLVIYDDSTEYQKIRNNLMGNREDIDRFKAVSVDECLALEPTLAKRSGPIVGGVYANQDNVGDSAVFSQKLMQICKQEFNVKFVTGEQVTELVRSNSKISAVRTDKNIVYGADRFVCCLGADSERLLRSVDVHLPIYPITGYSLTLPLGTDVPEVAITDAQRKIVFSRIGDQVRIAGFADFGFTTRAHEEERLMALRQTAKETMPCIADYDSQGKEWVGLRPSTPDSLPIVGKSKYDNLFLNMGHGMFGWTLAAGTAHSIADQFASVDHPTRVPVGHAA